MLLFLRFENYLYKQKKRGLIMRIGFCGLRLPHFPYTKSAHAEKQQRDHHSYSMGSL